jgi:two-component system sensor kinase FixL
MEIKPKNDNKVLTDPTPTGEVGNGEELLRETLLLRTRVAGLERVQHEQQRVERALIRSLQEWEATFNATKDSIVVVDNDFNIIQANHAASRFFGKPAGKILGQAVTNMLYGENKQIGDCPLVMAKQTSKHEETELYIPQKDIWIAVSADPIFDEDGDLPCFVFIIRDITYRKKSEQILAKLNADLHKTVLELKKSNQELRSFAHVIAHDLKSPLRGIGSIADRLIRKNNNLDNEGKDQLRLLIIRVKRMGDFIDGILRYSEIGHIFEQQEAVDVNSLVTEIISEIAMPENFNIIAENLPTIYCERVRLKQILQNLISNAVKFADKPGPVIKIDCIDEGACWKFSVADNGCGIKEQYFEKIFEIFQTLSSRDKNENTGIGLTIVKKIVELYGGKVWVTSKPDEGSTFFFTLSKQRIEGTKNANT